MLARHSLFTSAIFIPLEGHMCAWQHHVTLSVNLIAQNSVHFLWKVPFMTSEDFFLITSIAYTPMECKTSKSSTLALEPQTKWFFQVARLHVLKKTPGFTMKTLVHLGQCPLLESKEMETSVHKDYSATKSNRKKLPKLSWLGSITVISSLKGRHNILSVSFTSTLL